MQQIKKITLLAVLACGSMALCAQQAQQKKVEIKHLTEAEFIQKVYDVNAGDKAVFKGKKSVIVDFYADWCGPCKRLAPYLEQALVDYKGKIEIYKVNVDKEKALAQKFGVSSIPLLLFFPVKGKPKQVLGFRPKEEIYGYIEELLLKTEK
ncbi:MAG: thioredoxin [Bacteroidales bacterium]|jgi:thioredoxin|nr:thioredoxin [Bacteroidales bacterium]